MIIFLYFTEKIRLLRQQEIWIQAFFILRCQQWESEGKGCFEPQQERRQGLSCQEVSPCPTAFIINFQLKMEIESNQFLKIAGLAAQMLDFHQIVQDQEAKLELLPFQISKLLPEKAVQTYHRIQKKYDSPNGIGVQPWTWLESQKRLFAWFLVFYTYINRDQAGKLPTIDFSQLAASLFNKNADFLQFHFLALVKNTEKTSWDQQKDELVLRAMKEQGMKWNEVSRRVFIETSKTVFLPPKSCRERWLNHLDNTKFKGNWHDTEDYAIFNHVVETQSKKWSKMVPLLGNKRSQHSIKNRFNTLIAKHRRYKSEKQLKVATRILTNLQRKVEIPARAKDQNQEQSKERLKLVVSNFEEQNEMQSREEEYENAEDCSCGREIVASEPEPLASSKGGDEVIVKQEENLEQEVAVVEVEVEGSVVREAPVEGFYPFQNYSYEQDMCSYAPHIFDFHQTHLFIYQQIITFAIPTADTMSRETRILEERRRHRPPSTPN